jgi:hypothetical protein
MKKYIFIFSFLSNFVFAEFTFSQNYFNLRYGYDSIQDIGATILTVDSGYYALDFSFYNSYKTKVSLSFIDVTGNLQWRKSYGVQGQYFAGGRSGKQLTLSYDYKKLYYAGSVIDSLNRNFGVLWSFNRDGDSLFCKYYGDSLTFYSNNHCQVTSDSCIIIAGAMNNGTTQAMLIKTDSLGNKLWEKNYGGSGSEYGCSVLQNLDGSFMMGITTTSFGGDVDMAVIKTDSIGNQQWLQPYSGAYNETSISYLIALSDGNYALSGGQGSSTINYGWLRLLKINPSGGVIWDKKYGGESFDASLTGVVENSADGSLIANGAKNSRGVILKTDINGDSLWLRSLIHPSISNVGSLGILWAIDTAFHNGFICAGVVTPLMPDTGSVDVWVIKVDEYGCDTLGCQFVSVSENEMDKGLVKVYPNPTTGELFIETENRMINEKEFSIQLYDFTGKLILQQPISNYQEKLAISSFSSGIYFLTVSNDKNIIDRIKIVKE